MMGFCFVDNIEKSFFSASIKNTANSFPTHTSERLWELNWSHSVWIWHCQKFAKVSTKFSVYTEVKVDCQHFLSTVLDSCCPLFRTFQSSQDCVTCKVLSVAWQDLWIWYFTHKFPCRLTPPQTKWKSMSTWNPRGYRAHKSSLMKQCFQMSFELEACHFSTPGLNLTYFPVLMDSPAYSLLSPRQGYNPDMVCAVLVPSPLSTPQNAWCRVPA